MKRLLSLLESKQKVNHEESLKLTEQITDLTVQRAELNSRLRNANKKNLALLDEKLELKEQNEKLTSKLSRVSGESEVKEFLHDITNSVVARLNNSSVGLLQGQNKELELGFLAQKLAHDAIKNGMDEVYQRNLNDLRSQLKHASLELTVKESVNDIIKSSVTNVNNLLSEEIEQLEEKNLALQRQLNALQVHDSFIAGKDMSMTWDGYGQDFSSSGANETFDNSNLETSLLSESDFVSGFNNSGQEKPLHDHSLSYTS